MANCVRFLVRTMALSMMVFCVNIVLLKVLLWQSAFGASFLTRQKDSSETSGNSLTFHHVERVRRAVDTPTADKLLSAPKLSKTLVTSRAQFGYVMKKILTSISPKPERKQDTQRPTDLDDLFIAVKTTRKYHQKRLQILLDTWISLAKAQTYFFTDDDDEKLASQTHTGHVINTGCPSGHQRKSLCCKMSVEFDAFLQSNKRWFCHMDDDTYANIPRLVETLRGFDHTRPWYLGKPSLNHPLETADRQNPSQRLAFWFATGGAGMCFSRAMALKMSPFASGGRLMTQCDNIRLPDDVTLGYIIEHLLGERLTVIHDFHSHLEGLWAYSKAQLPKMITFSYSSYKDLRNVIDVPGLNDSGDPTRFLSAHCQLFPSLKNCQTEQIRSMQRLR